MSTATPAPAASTATTTTATANPRRNGLRTGFLTPPHAPQLHNNNTNSQLSMMLHGNDPDGAARASNEDRETAMVVDPGLQVYWHSLALEHRRKLLKLSKKDLFTRIRTSCCSGCFGLFQMRYEELKNHLSGTCPVCHDCYAGLVITEDGGVTLGEQILGSNPFPTFGESRCREREREMHFMTGDICGSGWQKKPGQNKCKLHTSHVPYEALSEYWTGLPCEQQATLLVLSEEQFVSELDGQMKCQLRICKECRCNVMRAFKELKPGRDGVQLQPSLPLCPNHELKFCDGMVKVEGTGEPVFFEAAEEVEEHKTFDPSTGNDTDNPDTIRHAETPELAREALQDSALLIFKSQVEVSFREQTASQNALLLFVYLIHTLMELQLGNAYKELSAKQAETELLLSLDLESAQAVARKEKKAAKRKNKKLAGIDEELDEKAAADFLLSTALPELAPVAVPVPEEPPAPLSKAQRRLANETAGRAGKAAAPAAPDMSPAAATPVQQVKAAAPNPAPHGAASPAPQAAAAAAAAVALPPAAAAQTAAAGKGGAAAAPGGKLPKGAAKRAAAAAAAETIDAAVAKALVTPRAGAEPAGPSPHEETPVSAVPIAQANGHAKARPSAVETTAAPATGGVKGGQHAGNAQVGTDNIVPAVVATAPVKGKQALQAAAASAQQHPHSHAVVTGPAAAPVASLAPAHNPHPQQPVPHPHDKQQHPHQQPNPPLQQAATGNVGGKASAQQHQTTEQPHPGNHPQHTGQVGVSTNTPLVMLQPVQEALQNTDKRQQGKLNAQNQQVTPAAAAAAAAALPMPTNAHKQPQQQHPTAAAANKPHAPPPTGRAPPPPHPYPTQAAANAPPAPPPPPTAPRHPPNNATPAPAHAPAAPPNRQQAAAAAAAAATAAQAAIMASQHAAAISLATLARGPPQPPAPQINSVEYPPLRPAAAPVPARNHNHHQHAVPPAPAQLQQQQPVVVVAALPGVVPLRDGPHHPVASPQVSMQRSSSTAQPVPAVPIPSPGALLTTVRSGPLPLAPESVPATHGPSVRGPPHVMGQPNPLQHQQQQHHAPMANGAHPQLQQQNQQAHMRQQQQYPSLAGPSPHAQQQQPDVLRHMGGAPPHGKAAPAGPPNPHQALPTGVVPARTVGGPLHHPAPESSAAVPGLAMPTFGPAHPPAPALGQTQQPQVPAGAGAARPFAVPICRPPSSNNLLPQHQQQTGIGGGAQHTHGVPLQQQPQQHGNQPGYNALEAPRLQQQQRQQQQQAHGWSGLQSHAPPAFQNPYGQQHHNNQQQQHLASKMLAQQQLDSSISNHPAAHLQHNVTHSQQQQHHHHLHQQHHPQYHGLMPQQVYPPGDTNVLRPLPANPMMAGNGQNGVGPGSVKPPLLYAHHAPHAHQPAQPAISEAVSFSFFSNFPPNYHIAGLGSRAGNDGHHVSNGGGSILGGDRGSTNHQAGHTLEGLDFGQWGTGAAAPVVASGKVNNAPAAMGGGAYSLFGMTQNTTALFAER